jgi:hypothetical protein
VHAWAIGVYCATVWVASVRWLAPTGAALARILESARKSESAAGSNASVRGGPERSL